MRDRDGDGRREGFPLTGQGGKHDVVKVIIAGGGTGGHLFPGVAIAREISRRWEDAGICFVTGKRNMEQEILERHGFDRQAIDVEGLKGRGWKRTAIGLVKLPWSLLQSISILRGFTPRVVVGVGGYSSGPVCLAARLMGIPSAIHEQNSFPGLTNRLLCRVVDRVFISFEESRPHFPGGNFMVTGNPVREDLFKETGERTRDRFTVLVMGGSQGARAINDAFVGALEIMRGQGRDPMVIHQSGRGNHRDVVEAYRTRALPGEVVPFIDDMAAVYSAADMIVSRAGATTVSELAALGKPSILIPYPYAANNHQEVNAQVLVAAKGAEMILERDLSPEVLAGRLMKYMDDKEALQAMGEGAKGIGRRDAARVIVDHLADMMQ
jgi:UDP-N-acetylglucosamine--N-acetylmuramyl-(pentapeptide) pyrophosphoryl-undecaprenol N-acetylglucosamine transferase